MLLDSHSPSTVIVQSAGPPAAVTYAALGVSVLAMLIGGLSFLVARKAYKESLSAAHVKLERIDYRSGVHAILAITNKTRGEIDIDLLCILWFVEVPNAAIDVPLDVGIISGEELPYRLIGKSTRRWKVDLEEVRDFVMRAKLAKHMENSKDKCFALGVRLGDGTSQYGSLIDTSECDKGFRSSGV